MKKSTPFQPVAQFSMGTKFADMTRRKKVVFVAQLILCIVTFGFAFPNVQSS